MGSRFRGSAQWEKHLKASQNRRAVLRAQDKCINGEHHPRPINGYSKCERCRAVHRGRPISKVASEVSDV